LTQLLKSGINRVELSEHAEIEKPASSMVIYGIRNQNNFAYFLTLLVLY